MLRRAALSRKKETPGTRLGCGEVRVAIGKRAALREMVTLSGRPCGPANSAELPAAQHLACHSVVEIMRRDRRAVVDGAGGEGGADVLITAGAFADAAGDVLWIVLLASAGRPIVGRVRPNSWPPSSQAGENCRLRVADRPAEVRVVAHLLEVDLTEAGGADACLSLGLIR